MFSRFGRLVAWVMALTDVALINLAFLLAYAVRYKLQWFKAVEDGYLASYSFYVPVALLLTAILVGVYKVEGVYDQRRTRHWLDEVYEIINGTTTGIMIIVFITFFMRPLVYSRLIFMYAGILIIVILSGARLVKGYMLGRLRQRGVGVNRVIIVGAGEVGRAVVANLVAEPKLGYEIIGIVDDNPDKGNADMGPFKGLGGTEQLGHIIDAGMVDEVIVTLPWMYHRKIMSILNQCERENVRARIVPDLFQMRLSRVQVEDLNGIPLLSVREPTISGWKLMTKRAIDVVCSFSMLLVCAPLMGLIALAIKLDSAGPVFFQQTRVGKDGRLFSIYKFRSMCQDAEDRLVELSQMNEAQGPLFKMRADPRCTRVGRVLRKTSLDELPQLYNVLKGDMSLVGPRPPLPQEVSLYQPWQRKRLEVAPGLTGLPQVSGRSNLSFDEMAFLDLYYIENWSPALDLMIMLRTIPQVLMGDGAF